MVEWGVNVKTKAVELANVIEHSRTANPIMADCVERRLQQEGFLL
jgi:hypothetical protein